MLILGQEEFRTITSSYYRGAKGMIIVFDVSDRSSFEHVSKWLTDLDSFKDTGAVVLVGNKIDVEEEDRVVSYDEAEEWAQDHQLHYYETSCKSGEGVEDMFVGVSRTILDII